jgi:hypothetical protein
MNNQKMNRKARARLAAEKVTWNGVLIGGLFGIAVIIMLVKTVPTISPLHLVQAQVAADNHRYTSATPSPAAAMQGDPISGPAPVKLTNGASPFQAASPEPPVPRPAPVNQLSNTEPKDEGGKYQKVGFDKLSTYRFDLTKEMMDARADPLGASLLVSQEIPAKVKAFDGKLVATKGFMLPVKLDHGLVTEFLLLKSQSACCYGIMPKINEWVSVRMAGGGVNAVMDQPITVCGILHVGECRENGLLVAVYRMDGDKLQAFTP